MEPGDFSLVTDDQDRLTEIVDAVISAIGAQPTPTIAEQDQINAEAAIRSIYGAQPAPSVPVAALRPVIDWLRNGCDPQEAAKELEILIGAALKPEAKP